MLIDCPVVNQRTEVGSDGRPPEDGNMDCVPSALASMARGLNPSLRVTGDDLHDQVYSQGYIGMQDPARFVSVLAAQDGMRLVGPVTGSAQALYGRAVAEIAAGHPVLLSIPSDWNDEPPHSAYAHMVAGCDVAGNGAQLTAMNPWTASYQTEDAGWWVERLNCCAYKALWVMERIVEGGTSVWQQQSDGSGKDDVGHVCGAGIMSYLVAHELTGSDGLLSETYYAGPRCFLPLASGRIVTAAPSGPGGSWEMDEEGAQALVSVWQQLGAATAKVGELEGQLEKAGNESGGGAEAYPAYKAAVDALRVALAAAADAG